MDLMEYAFAIQEAVEAPKKSANDVRECIALDSLGRKESSRRNEKGSAHLFVQLGYFDDPDTGDRSSIDYQIAENFVRYLSFCGFSQEESSSVSHRTFMKDGIIKVTLGLASREGRFDREFSNSARREFFQTLRNGGVDYLITVGHSRHGRGLDLYPVNLGSKNVIPVYSEQFYKEMPASVKGIALLGCDSKRHLSTQATQARREGQAYKLIDVQGLFYSQDGVKRIFETLDRF
ncbi:MAG: hypothetical protein NDJ89_13485 [Oligoflexia bacterium]|nr:hypothetical protein [Oligoflexia bacterium]